MRILFLSHRFPYPPTFGSKVRAFNIIRHLSASHQVTVLSLARNAQEQAASQGIAGHCHAFEAIRVRNPIQLLKIAATLPTPVSATEAFFHSAAMKAAVQRELGCQSFDFVFVHCSSVGHYVEDVPLPKMLDFCDVDSRKWYDYAAFKAVPLSWGYEWEARRVAALERRLASRFGEVTVTTAGEVEALAQAGVRERTDWFANGVDLDYFCPGSADYDENVISFVGRMDYFPNEQAMVDFCAEVWPLLRRRRPTLRLIIVGAEPTHRVRRLARLDGVVVTGSVPDVRPYVRSSALTVTPLKIARGTQNKILEAMAMRVPVVASSQAAKGVDALPGVHLRVADDPVELAETILQVLGDRAERERLALAGLERVRSHHTWQGALSRLDGIMARCLLPSSAPAVPLAGLVRSS